MVEVEKAGVPTVLATTTEFAGLARSSSQSFGVAEQSFVVVPHPMGMIKLEEIRAKADAMYPEIVKAATQWKPTGIKLQAGKPPYPAEVIDFEGTEVDVNDTFFKNGWSMGLPIIAPTPERVKAMLAGTKHKPDEVLGEVPPRAATLTVELAATHAVMAGCKPMHLPVLLASLEALLKPEAGWRGALTTTHPAAPYVVVSGPIRDQIGLGYSTRAAGRGNLANECIGVAIDSIAQVVGGAKAPDADKKTLGWAGQTIATVIGENEKGSPWDPLHVRRGFQKDESVVTVHAWASIPVNFEDHAAVEGKDLLLHLANTINTAGQNSRFFTNVDVLVVLSPEHAATLYSTGWKNLNDIRKYLWDNARIPLKVDPGRAANIANLAVPAGFGKITVDTPLPLVPEPARFEIIVAGGPGKHSQYVPAAQQCPRLISVSVDKWK